MTKLIIALLIFIPVFYSFSQANDGDIEIKKSFGGLKFYQNNERLKVKEVLHIMSSDPEAHVEFKKAKANYDGANVLGFIGGFGVGWTLGTALGGGDPQWGLAAAGAGLIILSIPLNNKFKKHSRNAVKIYNGVTSSVKEKKYSLSLVPLGTGAKLSLRFN